MTRRLLLSLLGSAVAVKDRLLTAAERIKECPPTSWMPAYEISLRDSVGIERSVMTTANGQPCFVAATSYVVTGIRVVSSSKLPKKAVTFTVNGNLSQGPIKRGDVLGVNFS